MAVEFVLARIDDRLMHGQVKVGWVKAILPDHIIIANDQAAGNDYERMLIEMASPAECGLTICAVADVKKVCRQEEMQGRKVLLLAASPSDMKVIVESGLDIRKINVGNMRYVPGKRQVMKTVAIDEKDENNFKELMKKQLTVTIQMVPTDEPIPISQYIK